MENQMQTLEPAAKVLAATALSQSLSFCTERKYLEKIGDKSLNDIFSLEAIPGTLREEAAWIEIRQNANHWKSRLKVVLLPYKRFCTHAFYPKRHNYCF